MPAAFFRVGTWLMATGRDMSIKELTELRRLCAPSALQCLCLVTVSLSIAHAAAALATLLRARVYTWHAAIIVTRRPRSRAGKLYC